MKTTVKKTIEISKEEVLANVMPRILPMGGEETVAGEDMYVTTWRYFRVAYYVDTEKIEGLKGMLKDKYMVITKRLVAALEVTGEEIEWAALENLDRVVTVLDLNRVLAEAVGAGCDLPEGEEITPGMLVISTTQQVYGAAAIMSRKAMGFVERIYGGRFSIMPSSVHEVIATPYNSDTAGLDEMVRTVNHDQVEPEDRLFDRALVCDQGSIRLPA